MPDPQAIREALTGIAQDAAPLAIAWHAALAVALAGLLLGWRPSQRLAALLLTVPLASVAAVAWFYEGFGARAWSSVLASLGLFYGIFGAMRLGVFIDTFLTIGAVILLGVAWSRHDLPLRQIHES